MKETLGEYIHYLRIEKGLTLTKCAAALDLDQSTLSKIENNKRQLSVATIPKIALMFNLELKPLLKEYYSEKIAEIIFQESDLTELFKLTKKKVEYFRLKRSTQGDSNLTPNSKP